MGQVMIKCPTTGKSLSTGMAMDEQSFESAQLINNVVGACPHCGQNHTWSKPDAWVENDLK